MLAGCAHTGGRVRRDPLGRPAPTTSTTAKARPTVREPKRYDATVRSVIADLQSYWSAEFPVVYPGDDYTPLKTFYAYASTTRMPSCAKERLPYLLLANNAFYCPDDDFIAWDDEQLFPRLDRRSGPFAVALVLAHEWGHAIQMRADVHESGVIMEQQADCFAGAWAQHVNKTSGSRAGFHLRSGDLDTALAGLIGFRDLVGTTASDPGAHGTGFDRVRAFQEGVAGGAKRCASYESDPPTLVGLAFANLSSRLFGGDAPFRKVVPSVTASLDAYWSSRNGAKPLVVSSVAAAKGATCSSPLIRVDGVPATTLSYCADGRTVRWDAKRIRAVYDNHGDFAVAVMFAELWARVDGGAPSTAAALCQAGDWTRVLFDATAPTPTPTTAGTETPTTAGTGNAGPTTAGTETAGPTTAGDLAVSPGDLTLSPGDLDEAVRALLGGEGLREPGAASAGFQRVDAFRIGFVEKARAC